MANDLTKNPWLIDTASPLVLSRDRLRLDMVMWDGAAIAVGDTFVLQDLDGRQITRTADTAKEGATIRFGSRFDLNGLIVPTLVNGKLTIFLS